VFLRSSDAIDDVIYRFTRTQSGDNITSLLDCGVRAFDWRPSLSADNRTLGFAHGPIFINHSMTSAAAEVVAWANAHAADAEDALVLLIVADCNGPACTSATAAAFASVGLPLLSGPEGCATASDLTLSAAMAAGALHGGGHALAIADCPSAPTPTYDETLGCTGFINATEGAAFEALVNECVSAPSAAEFAACVATVLGIADVPAHYACYMDGSGRDPEIPFSRLLAWNAAAAAVPPPTAPGSRGLLTSLQGCWAQSYTSTVLSFLHDSSLLIDETRAEFNAVALLSWINATVEPRPLKYVNLVGLNNACSGAGPTLLAELRKRLPNA